ncbi:MAG: glycosyltransferase family 4 protein [Oligoflexus sp.]
MPTYIIAAPTLAARDAVGNDILLEKQAIEELTGNPVFLYAEHVDPELAGQVISERMFLDHLSNPHNVFIYHYCVYWAHLERYLPSCQAETWIRYHSLTPPHFFEPYDHASHYATHMGFEQLKTLARRFPYVRYLATSQYTANELHEYGISYTKIDRLPPFAHLSDKSSNSLAPHATRSGELKNLQVLFVGRVVPNKGHLNLIRVIARYAELYGNGIQLNIVGSISGQFAAYYREIEKLVTELNVASLVNFTGKVSSEELQRHYRESDVFLCLSEHEGFCVPLLEAQSHGLPVIALNRGAVGDTLGYQQLVFENFDEAELATALELVRRKPDIRDYLIEEGRRNLQRFDSTTLKQRLVMLLQAQQAISGQWQIGGEDKKLRETESLA